MHGLFICWKFCLILIQSLLLPYVHVVISMCITVNINILLSCLPQVAGLDLNKQDTQGKPDIKIINK